RTYTPPAHLREYVIARDRGCQFPGCSQPSHRCDLDHVEAFTASTDSGPTSADNLISLCRRHHQLKTHHRWRVRIIKPPDRQTGETIIEWTSPRGRLHQQPRPPQLQHLPPTQPARPIEANDLPDAASGLTGLERRLFDAAA
ncbi:MAG: HNH endonuclease signature motif containing protein, partial [Candidatus Nanopelagicales bacterium]